MEITVDAPPKEKRRYAVPSYILYRLRASDRRQMLIRLLTFTGVVLGLIYLLNKVPWRAADLFSAGSMAGYAFRRSMLADHSVRAELCSLSNPCHIALIADRDTDSRDGEEYVSQFAYGTFFLDSKGELAIGDGYKRESAVLSTLSAFAEADVETDQPTEGLIENIVFNVEFSAPQEVRGKLSESGRGMELSELVLWGDDLLSFDDRTGIVYALRVKVGDDVVPMAKYTESRPSTETHNLPQVIPIPRYILTESESSPKGMKIEWATIGAGGDLYVGSFGKEYTTADGKQITSEHNFSIVRIRELGSAHAQFPEVERLNWKPIYTAMREATGTTFPGYLIHEAASYSPYTGDWIFLPRRVSTQQYDEIADQTRGSNKMIVVNSRDMLNSSKMVIRDVNFGTQEPSRGFSSFKFVPGTNDKLIIAIRSAEDVTIGTQSTYLSIFDIYGRVVLPEVEVSDKYKFEGLEVW